LAACNGGLGERAVYRVRFENTVSGLRTGAAVSFNGIRVGEVIKLQLNPKNPGQVFVTIAIDPGTPIRADTQARIDVQGLMGSPSIALNGGSPNLPAPAASQGEPPLLVAGATAGQDLTQSARELLGRIDKILAENSDFASRHDREFRYVFRGARAQFEKHRRNPRRSREDIWRRGVEGPSAHIRSDRSARCRCAFQKAGKELVVADPTTLVRNDTQRIIVVASDGHSSFLDNAQWPDSAPKLLQAKIIQSLENANFLAGVGRPSDG